MKILMISIDSDVFRSGTEVAERMRKYGELVERLFIIVLTAKEVSLTKLSEKVVMYPARGSLRIVRVIRGIQIASAILREEIKKGVQMLVTAQDFVGILGAVLKKRFGVQFEMQLHTDFLSPYFRGFKNLIYRHLALWALKRADCVRVVSHRIKHSLEIRNLKLEIKVLPICTPLPKIAGEDIHSKYRNFDFIILMVSRLTKEKNIGMAIDAMAEIVKEFPKTLLLIVGSGPEENNLKLKTYNLKLTNNVHFEGGKENIGDYYRAANLYLLTSDFEGWGRTVIEAASMGVPVVMTNVGLAGEVIAHEKSGLVFEPRDKDGLVKILQKIFRKEFDIKALSDEARNRVQSYLDEHGYLEKLKKAWEQCAF